MNDVEKNQVQEIELLLTESETQATFSKELIRAEKVKILVSGDDLCSGTYYISKEKSFQAPKNKVWKLKGRDRYIFNNGSILGWRIGRKKQLKTGNYIFKSNLTTLPPLEEEVEWKQHDGSAIQIKCLLCTNEDFDAHREKRRLWSINWKELKNELKNSKSACQKREATNIIVGFITGAISLFSSLFDIVSDGLVSKSFIYGTDYIKDVRNQTDPVVTNNSTNCTLIGHNIFNYTLESTSNKIEEFFRYSCTEYDPFWGWLAFAFIFLPGVVFSYMTAQKLRKSPYFWIFLCFTPLTTVIFPFLLILVKILVLFHNGPELNRLNDCLTFAEGQIESVCQLGLQLYIIFKKVDRQPSTIQMLSLPASALMLIRVQVNNYYARIEAPSVMADIKRKIFISPIFLFKTLSFLGSAVLVAVIDPLVLAVNLVTYLIVLWVIVQLRKIDKISKCRPFLGFLLMINALLWPLVLSIWATVTANISSDFRHDYFNAFAGLIFSGEILFIISLICTLNKTNDETQSLLFFTPIGMF